MLQKVSFVVLLIAISLIATNLHAQIVEDGLVSYWSFDANNIIDEFSVYDRVLEEAEVSQNFKSDTGLAVDPKSKLAVTWGALKARR